MCEGIAVHVELYSDTGSHTSNHIAFNRHRSYSVLILSSL